MQINNDSNKTKTSESAGSNPTTSDITVADKQIFIGHSSDNMVQLDGQF